MIGIVMVAAADFTLYELDAIVDDPADRRVLKTGGDRIFLSPGYHALRGIHVSDGGPGCCGANVAPPV